MVLKNIRTRAASALLALSVIGGGAAMAQTPPATPAAISPMSDAEAEKFVAANRKVTEVANSLTVELQAAKTQADANAIQVKAEQQMVAAIEREGITAKRYTEIIQLAETDEATLKKLRAKAGG